MMYLMSNVWKTDLSSTEAPLFALEPLERYSVGGDGAAGSLASILRLTAYNIPGANMVLRGGAGRDFLYGDWGNDTLKGRAGNDHLDGQSGNDRIYGGSGDDILLGEMGNDVLRGGGGKDRLYGGGGNDKLSGNGGKDWLYGGPGDDVLRGGGGKDLLIGGGGDDKLTGGSGRDSFVFEPGFEFGDDVFESHDIVTDFKTNIDDIIISDIEISSFKELKRKHLFQEGDDVVIRTNSATFTLQDVDLVDLDRNDFRFEIVVVI